MITITTIVHAWAMPYLMQIFPTTSKQAHLHTLMPQHTREHLFPKYATNVHKSRRPLATEYETTTKLGGLQITAPLK